jgi:hypothetical protein
MTVVQGAGVGGAPVYANISVDENRHFDNGWPPEIGRGTPTSSTNASGRR